MPISYEGKLYRALNPLYAREPLSGRGAAIHGGRFNRKGMPALYLFLSIETAVREANQVGSLQPTMLLSYEAEAHSIFDTRDEAALQSAGFDAAGLSQPTWRDEMRTVGVAGTQRLAERLIAEGCTGLLVRSFAPGTSSASLNLVLWQWNDTAKVRLRLIDDEGRLSR